MLEHTIRRWVRLGLVVGSFALAAMAVASSLQFDQTHRGPAKRTTREPRLVFVDGVLQQGRHGNWQLQDGTPLGVPRDLTWREERGGRASRPATGRHVRLMGQYVGGTLMVRQATLIPLQRVAEALGGTRTIDPAEAASDDLPR